MAATTVLGLTGVSRTDGAAPPLQNRRKYDRSDKIIMKGLADAPLLHIMIKRGQKRAVGDIKYYMFEDDYFVQSGTLKGCTAAGADAALTTGLQYMYIAGDASEKGNTLLRPNDIIHIPAFQDNQTNTKGTGNGTTDGAVGMAGEDVRIREFVTDNVALVTRGGGEGTLTTNITAGSGNTLKWEYKGNALPDASASPVARAQAIDEDYNYRQVMRLSWDVSGRNLMQDMYGPSDIQRYAVKNRTQFLRNLERTFWTGHRYIAYSANGLEQSTTGGAFEYIVDTSTTRKAVYDASKDLLEGDASQRVWKVNKNFGLDNYNRFMEKALKYGSRNKLGVGGREFLVTLESMLRPYYGSFDWDVDSFGFGVVMARCSFGRIPIVVEQEWSDCAAGYGYFFASVDMDYMWYVYGAGPCAIKGCGNTNSDVHLHQEIQGNDEAHRKDELFADFGFDQRFRKAHSLIVAEASTIS